MINKTISFAKHGTTTGVCPIAPPSWFLFPSYVYLDERMCKELTGDSIKVYSYMIYLQTVISNNSDRVNTKEWASNIGLTQGVLLKSLEQLYDEKLINIAWKHSCGFVTFESPPQKCTKCSLATCDDTEVIYRTVQSSGQINAINSNIDIEQKTIKPKGRPRKNPVPKKESQKAVESDQDKEGYKKIKETVHKLAVASGLPEQMLYNAMFWQNWNRVILDWRKRLDGTGYGDDDIVRALYVFYNSYYNFDAPRSMVNDISLAIAGKVSKRKGDGRKVLTMPNYGGQTYSTNDIYSDEEITADDLLEETIREDRGVSVGENRYI